MHKRFALFVAELRPSTLAYIHICKLVLHYIGVYMSVLLNVFESIHARASHLHELVWNFELAFVLVYGGLPVITMYACMYVCFLRNSHLACFCPCLQCFACYHHVCMHACMSVCMFIWDLDLALTGPYLQSSAGYDYVCMYICMTMYVYM
jgi:hypothetical protein